MILEDLRLCLSNHVTVADCAVGRHLHDCSPATARTTPPQCQRGRRLGAVAICIGMLHCWHSLSIRAVPKIPHPDFRDSAKPDWVGLGYSRMSHPQAPSRPGPICELVT